MEIKRNQADRKLFQKRWPDFSLTMLLDKQPTQALFRGVIMEEGTTEALSRSLEIQVKIQTVTEKRMYICIPKAEY